MLLSEAILMGIGFIKEERRAFLDVTDIPPCGCALGTAVYSAGYRGNNSSVPEEVTRLWPWTAQPYKDGVAIWEEASCKHFDGMPREQVAAWVAEQEVLLGIVDAEAKQEIVEAEHAPA